jgi:chromosome partitioning protein
MAERPIASFYHADTMDLKACNEIAETVRAIVSGLTVECFPSQNGQQVIFELKHSNVLARSSAIMLVKQFLRHYLDQTAKMNYENLRVIAVANEKGGVAKTTSCVNLAACLAMHNRRVLLIDLDAQANATLGLGLSPAKLKHDPQELLTEPMFPLHRYILPTEIPHLDIIPAGPSLHEANLSLVRAVGRELKLRNKIVGYLKEGTGTHYDYIVIDSPPAADILTLNVLMAATHLVVPVQASYYSLSGMARLGATVDSLYEALDPKVKMLGILVTMYDGNIPAQRAAYELLKEKLEQEYGPYLFSKTVSRSEMMLESEAGQLPIVLTHPRSQAAEEYREIAAEILSRIEGEAKEEPLALFS